MDAHDFVRAAVAGCAETPPDLVRALANDHHAGVRREVASHAPADVRARLARDPDPDVRHAVVFARALEPALLDQLAQDADRAVRTTAIARRAREAAQRRWGH